MTDSEKGVITALIENTYDRENLLKYIIKEYEEYYDIDEFNIFIKEAIKEKYLNPALVNILYSVDELQSYAITRYLYKNNLYETYSELSKFYRSNKNESKIIFSIPHIGIRDYSYYIEENEDNIVINLCPYNKINYKLVLTLDSGKITPFENILINGIFFIFCLEICNYNEKFKNNYFVNFPFANFLL